MWPHYVTWLLVGIVGFVLIGVAFSIWDDLQKLKRWAGLAVDAGLKPNQRNRGE